MSKLKLIGSSLFLILLIFCFGAIKVNFILAVELVNINTAGLEELDTLPGIGASKAQAIIDYRELNGLFGVIEDIMNVSGIGQATFDNIKNNITTEDSSSENIEEAIVVEENLNNNILVVPVSPVMNSEPQADNYDYKKHITISEIFPNPEGDDSEFEFIEFYNNGDRDIKLSEWRLGDDSKKRYKFNENDIIPASGYFVIFRKENKIALNNSGDSVNLFSAQDEKPFLSVVYKKSEEGESYSFDQNKNKYFWSLKPTPGAENIIEAKNNLPVVVLNIPKEWPVGRPLVFDSSDTDDEDGDKLYYSWDFGDGFKNNLSSPEHTFFKSGEFLIKLIVNDGKDEVMIERKIKIIGNNVSNIYSSFNINKNNLIISEVMPNPKGDDSAGEWIEIYNKGEESINLLGLSIDDEEGGSKPYIFKDIIIAPDNFYVLKREESGLALNNDADAVRIFDESGNIIDEVVYSGAKEERSYALGKNGAFFWTSDLTPGEDNVIAIANDYNSDVVFSSVVKKEIIIEEMELKNLDGTEEGVKIITKGIVLVEPGILGSQSFYIVPFDIDEKIFDYGEKFRGAQVYNYKKLFPEIGAGDYIEIIGEVGYVGPEIRIKTKLAEDIVILEHYDLPAPEEAECAEINENYLGKFIKVSGEITEKKGSSFYIDDGSGEVLVYIKKASGIVLADFKVGDKVELSGIVNLNKEDLRIMPRVKNDLIKIEENNLEEEGVVQGVKIEDSKEVAWREEAIDRKIKLFEYLLIIAFGVIVVLGGLLTKEVLRSKK